MGVAERDAMQRDVDWLENGWRWLAENEGDPRHLQMETAWLERLRQYEQAYQIVWPCEKQEA